MKHLALLASVYALIAALVLPGSILAQEDAAPPAETETAPAEQAAPPPEAPPAEPAPAEPAPAPEPQFLADERAEAPEPAPKAVAAASGSVTVSDFTFSPGTITINQGDTVTWVNNGPTPHSATSSSGAIRHGHFSQGPEPVAHVQRSRDVRLHMHAPPVHEGHGGRAGGPDQWRC